MKLHSRYCCPWNRQNSGSLVRTEYLPRIITSNLHTGYSKVKVVGLSIHFDGRGTMSTPPSRSLSNIHRMESNVSIIYRLGSKFGPIRLRSW